MADEKPANKYGATPKKLALISALAVTLIGTVYWNFVRKPNANPPVTSNEEDRSDRPSAERQADGSGDRDGNSDATVVDRLAKQLRAKAWPDYAVAEVEVFDPFSLPSSFPQPPEPGAIADAPVGTRDEAAAALAAEKARRAAARAEALDALRRQGVQVVLKGADEFVAMIGEREIRVGDEIEGLTVVHIGTDGVKLNRVKAK